MSCAPTKPEGKMILELKAGATALSTVKPLPLGAIWESAEADPSLAPLQKVPMSEAFIALREMLAEDFT